MQQIEHIIDQFLVLFTLMIGNPRAYNASGCYDEDEIFVQVNSLEPGSISVSGTTIVCENSSDVVIINSTASGTINGVEAGMVIISGNFYR